MPQKNVDFVLIMCKDSFISPFELGRATQFWWEFVFILAFGKPGQLLDCGPRLPWWNVGMIKPHRLWIWPRQKTQPAETLRDWGGLGGGWGSDVPVSPWSLHSCSMRESVPRILKGASGNSRGLQPCSTVTESRAEITARIGPESCSLYLLPTFGSFSHIWVFKFLLGENHKHSSYCPMRSYFSCSCVLLSLYKIRRVIIHNKRSNTSFPKTCSLLWYRWFILSVPSSQAHLITLLKEQRNSFTQRVPLRDVLSSPL